MQNNDDYITISELTRLVGISPAAVYKRINNQGCCVDNTYKNG